AHLSFLAFSVRQYPGGCAAPAAQGGQRPPPARRGRARRAAPRSARSALLTGVRPHVYTINIWCYVDSVNNATHPRTETEMALLPSPNLRPLAPARAARPAARTAP
ncbi:MAG: hypothetical protein ACK56I_25155, partial [bacterium]